MSYHLDIIYYILYIFLFAVSCFIIYYVQTKDVKSERRTKEKNDRDLEDEKSSNPSNDTVANQGNSLSSTKRRTQSSPEMSKNNCTSSLKNNGARYNNNYHAKPKLMTSKSADSAVDKTFNQAMMHDELFGKSVIDQEDSSFVDKSDGSSKLLTQQTSLHVEMENLYQTKYSQVTKKRILERLEVQEFDPNFKNSLGQSILHTAAKYCWPVTEDKLEVIKKILELEKLDIDVKDMDGRTALHYCVYKSAKLDILKLLLKYNASVNCLDNSGYAPIHYACMKEKNGLHGILKFMLDNSDKFDVNLQDGQGKKTPLHTAVHPKLSECVVKLLLDSPDVDVNIEDKDKKTPLHYICRKKNQHKNIAMFLERCELEINHQDNLGRTVLHYAAACGDNAQSLKLLIDHPGICLNIRDDNKRTPLHSCAIANDTTMLNLLLNQKGIDVSCIDRYHQTVLHHCANAGASVEIIEKIVQLCTNDIVSWRDSYGVTALEIAAQKGNQKIADVLQKLHNSLYTRRISLENANFSDLLHETDGHHLVKRILLEKKERIKETTEKNQTFLHILVGSFSPNRKLSLEIVLKSKLIDVNSKDCDGLTPLHYAVNMPSTDYVKLLLEQTDIDVNMTDKQGQTPLHYAAKIVHSEIAKLLICHAAININISDNKKKSALHYVCKSKSESRSEMIELMLNHNHVELKSLDCKCRSVFHYCCISGQPICTIEKLIEKMTDDHEALTGLDHYGKTPYYYAKQNGHTHILVALENAQLASSDNKTVSQLLPSHLKQLSDLKKKVGVYFWEKFCWKLHEKELVRFTDTEISVIKDPTQYELGKIVIENIQTKNPTFTTTDLHNTALKIKRHDICNLLNVEEATISAVSCELKYQLCILCGKRVPGIPGPEIIAEECGILNDNLNTELTERKVDKCPIVALFNIIKIRNPTLSLTTIVEIFNDLKFISLANTLKKINSQSGFKSTRRLSISRVKT